MVSSDIYNYKPFLEMPKTASRDPRPATRLTDVGCYLQNKIWNLRISLHFWEQWKVFGFLWVEIK